jgi:hypothetical protein
MSKDLDKLVEDVLQEYFALTGPSLPTAGSVSFQDVGPFSQYVGSSIATLDRILDIVNSDVAEIDKLDAQEFLYKSVPRLLAKIDTICDAMERKTGYKKLSKEKASPLSPPHKRSSKKLKIK